MNPLRATVALALLLAPSAALAVVDPACQGITTPDDYSDEVQQDFLLNYFALSTTFSPLHKPVPHRPGHGSVNLEVAIIPPLSCERRFAYGHSKTEDTNKAPVVPRPRVLFAFPQVGKVVPYAGLGYVPPVTVFGTRNVIISAEAGLGVPLDSGLELGLRYHHTLMKTVANVATANVDGTEEFDDFYVGSTFGFDLMGGYKLGPLTPYLALGLTDASTFFYVGDTPAIVDNTTPYFGFTGSLGAQATLGDHVSLAGEFYTAPGYIYTGRLRAGWVF